MTTDAYYQFDRVNEYLQGIISLANKNGFILLNGNASEYAAQIPPTAPQKYVLDEKTFHILHTHLIYSI